MGVARVATNCRACRIWPEKTPSTRIAEVGIDLDTFAQSRPLKGGNVYQWPFRLLLDVVTDKSSACRIDRAGPVYKHEIPDSAPLGMGSMPRLV
jgi:hypothetical protein